MLEFFRICLLNYLMEKKQMTSEELQKNYADAIITLIMKSAQQHICDVEERLIIIDALEEAAEYFSKWNKNLDLPLHRL